MLVIDGLFFSSPSVRHKELLHLIDSGIRVYGCSSMGALRAAELRNYGMVGMGVVFRLVAIGAIERDDEVAIIHASAEEQFASLTDALVSVRVAARRARRNGILDRDNEEMIVRAASSIPFVRRRYPVILQEALRNGADERRCKTFMDTVREQRCDVKAEDAILALTAIKRRSHSMATQHPRSAPSQTAYLKQWLRSASGDWVEGQWVSDFSVLTLSQLFANDYVSFHYSTVLRLLVDVEHGISGAEIHHRPEELERLAADCARARGFISPTGKASWGLQELLPGSRAAQPTDAQIARALVRSFRYYPDMLPAEDLCTALKSSRQFVIAQRLVAQIHSFNRALAERGQRYSIDRVSSQRTIEWFLRSWKAPRMEPVIYDRGFASPDDFVRRAKEYLPYAMAKGVPDLVLGTNGGRG